MVPKLVGVAAVAFLIFFLLTAPHQAHDISVGAAHLVVRIAKGIRDFVTSFH